MGLKKKELLMESSFNLKPKLDEDTRVMSGV